MKTKTIRSACILLTIAALCLFAAACGDKSGSEDPAPQSTATHVLMFFSFLSLCIMPPRTLIRFLLQLLLML